MKGESARLSAIRSEASLKWEIRRGMGEKNFQTRSQAFRQETCRHLLSTRKRDWLTSSSSPFGLWPLSVSR
jgi:hypothetical protein